MSVQIRYACPHCNRRILHHAALAGQLVICSACKGEFYEPTDPLPGKPAEKALKAQPQEMRRLRVPEGSNPKHDLAVLSRRDATDFRTIAEIVEAVLLDDDPPLPTIESPSSIGEETVNDFGYKKPGERGPAKPQQMPSAQPPMASPQSPTPSGRAPQARPANPTSPSNLAGPAMRPLVPPSTLIPTAMASTPQPSRSIPKPSVPVPNANRPTPAPGLAGVSIKQMVEELRRRGLGVSLITYDMAPMRNLELAFSDNMTREDALALLRKYLDTLRDPHAKPAEQGLLKRMWKKGNGE